jgi:hypothetical protein
MLNLPELCIVLELKEAIDEFCKEVDKRPFSQRRVFLEIFVGLLCGYTRQEVAKRLMKKFGYSKSYALTLYDKTVKIFRGRKSIPLGRLQVGFGFRRESRREIIKWGRPPAPTCEKDVVGDYGRPPVAYTFLPPTLPKDLQEKIIICLLFCSDSLQRLLKLLLESCEEDDQLKNSLLEYLQKISVITNTNIEPLLKKLVEAKTPDQLRTVEDELDRLIQSQKQPIYKQALQMLFTSTQQKEDQTHNTSLT